MLSQKLRGIPQGRRVCVVCGDADAILGGFPLPFALLWLFLTKMRNWGLGVRVPNRFVLTTDGERSGEVRA